VGVEGMTSNTEYVEAYRKQLKAVANTPEDAMKLVRLTCFMGCLLFTKQKPSGYTMSVLEDNVKDITKFYLTLREGKSEIDHRFFINHYSKLVAEEIQGTYREYEWSIKSIQRSQDEYNGEHYAKAVMLNASEHYGYDPEDLSGFNIFTGLKTLH
jgi:hypothetical protein